MIAFITPATQPIVRMKGEAVFANSRDVAAYFSKEHRNVLIAIDKLLKDMGPEGVLNFKQGGYTLPATGDQLHRCYEMDRRGFTLLSMGFTGKKALAFKLRYIDAFEAAEDELRRINTARQTLDPNDPAQLRELLLGYSERTLALESRVQELEPKSQALDRISTSFGSMCVTDAAKSLQMRPKDLFEYLRSNGWLYRRGTSNQYRAYESKLASGLMEHKITPPDEHGRTFEQARVTRKGLTCLAEIHAQQGLALPAHKGGL